MAERDDKTMDDLARKLCKEADNDPSKLTADVLLGRDPSLLRLIYLIEAYQAGRDTVYEMAAYTDDKMSDFDGGPSSVLRMSRATAFADSWRTKRGL